MTNWLARWNMPGYLPESEPVVFGNYSEAVDYVLDTLMEWNDMNALNYEGDDEYDETDYLTVVSEIEGQRVNGAEIAATFDGYIFRVTPTTQEIEEEE